MADTNLSPIANRYNVEHRLQGYDANGKIKPGGVRFSDIPGWDSVHTGINGYVEDRSGASVGIQTFEPDKLGLKEPFRMGRFLLKIMKYPPFFTAKACEIARWLFEDQVRGFDGIPENSLSLIDMEIGATGIGMSFPGMYKQNGKDFSIKTPEWKGRPLGKFIEWWIGALSDRETGIGHLWGRDMAYIRPNYGMTFLYVILGPDARPESIEYSCLFYDAFPTKEIAGYMSSNTLGDVGSVGEQDVQFTGIYQSNYETGLVAQSVVAQLGLYNETYIDAILPSYLYKGYLGADADTIKKNANVVTVNNLERIKMTAEMGITGYTQDVIDIISATKERAYGKENENSPKQQYPLDLAIERAFMNYNDRMSAEIEYPS